MQGLMDARVATDIVSGPLALIADCFVSNSNTSTTESGNTQKTRTPLPLSKEVQSFLARKEGNQVIMIVGQRQLTLAEAPVPVLGKCRIVRHAVVQIETADPTIREVQMHLVAQPPLQPDAEAISDHSIRISSSGSTDARPLSR